jgi:hypothetical protein
MRGRLELHVVTARLAHVHHGDGALRPEDLHADELPRELRVLPDRQRRLRSQDMRERRGLRGRVRRRVVLVRPRAVRPDARLTCRALGMKAAIKKPSLASTFVAVRQGVIHA